MLLGAVQSSFPPFFLPVLPLPTPTVSFCFGSRARARHLGSFRVQHFDEEVIVGYVPVQVLAVQVFFRLQADGPDFRQSQEQLPKFLRLLRVVAHRVVQQGGVHLFLDPFHQLEVLKVFDIWI